tara:strand:+ start:108 stop:542 length:435 start_codon:yes stop_codon:yes gene_type:complete
MITVTGGNPKQRRYVESMVQFCIDTLMPRMRTLEIEVKLCSPKGAMGYCLELDNNREFEIEVDRTLSYRKMLETVAHEMVHVKQYARRELHPSIAAWRGKTYNTTKTSYWDLPWEIEAHGRETGLFVRWAEKERVAHLKWTQTG